VIEAAVLIEANWVPLVDEVWVVRASPEAVVERIATERGLAAAQIRARIESQIDDEERRSHADVVIENTAGLDDLRARVEAAWQRIAG
jgi:dephospho-CoA kinase